MTRVIFAARVLFLMPANVIFTTCGLAQDSVLSWHSQSAFLRTPRLKDLYVKDGQKVDRFK